MDESANPREEFKVFKALGFESEKIVFSCKFINTSQRHDVRVNIATFRLTSLRSQESLKPTSKR